MAKLPEPDPGYLRSLDPDQSCLGAGTPLARIYFSAGDHPARWHEFRHWGPSHKHRFDHHLPDPKTGQGCHQQRAIYYAAPLAMTCIAEVFQQTRAINREAGDPWLVVFDTAAELKLLDLTGEFATRMGASLAIHSGPRDRARRWARALREAFPAFDGLYYLSSMHPSGRAVALNERARRAIPPRPAFNRALSDATLTDLIDASAHRLGYVLT